MLIENGILKDVQSSDIELLEKDPEIFFEFIKVIYNNAFSYLNNLHTLTIPKKILNIEERFITDCFSLKNIKIAGNIKKIGKYLFENYEELESVSLPNSLEEIEELAFYNCKKLKNIKLSENLNKIGCCCFSNCNSLEKISIPRKVREIEEETFKNCSNLRRVGYLFLVEKIGDRAFENCVSLQEIVFDAKLKYIGENAFKNCTSLKKVVFKNESIDIKNSAFTNCDFNYFVVYSKKRRMLCSDKINFEESSKCDCYDLNLFKKVFLGFGIEKLFNKNINYDNLNRLAEHLNKKNICLPIDFSLEMLDKQESINFKYYKQLVPYLKNQSIENINLFCGFARTIGLFENMAVEERISKSGNKIVNTIDYAQKAGEFLKETLNKQIISIDSMNYIFNGFKDTKFKKDFMLLIMKDKNLEKLIKISCDKNDFISKMYNNFEEVQLANSNDKGSHNYLAPTIEKFVSYFDEFKFLDDEEEKELGKELAKFYDEKELFEYAKEVKKQAIKNETKPNLVGVNIEEKTLLNINKHREDIVKVSRKILNELIKLGNDKFTFEWLRKDSAINFTLGKYCNCCSHIADIGDGVVKASVVHPDVQNLILRDKQGTIVAKSTLYINRKEQYGVFNNVEVSYRVPENLKEYVYEKYILAIKAFADIYNKENPDKPLKKINVGMRFNDLSDQIKRYCLIGPSFESIHYNKYSRATTPYDNDSKERQYTIWEYKEPKIIKK